MVNMLSENNQRQPLLTYEQANIINEYRLIMSRLVYLTRFYIIARLTDVGDEESIRNRLLEIPVEINQLRQGIPGITEDSTPVTMDYLVNVLSLINGMISGDQALAAESIRQLNIISDEYSAYLATLSPYWDEATWRSLFSRYNRALIGEVIALQAGDYNSALDIFEGLIRLALARGDYYAEGVIRLLPEGSPEIPTVYFNMIKDFRKIRTEWAYLTRFYIVASITGIDESDYLTQKFSQLISRMREKFELILGYEAAEELANILLIYVVRLQGLVQAILSGDEASIQTAADSLNEFTDRLTVYLGSINPYWDEMKWTELFETSIDLIVALGQTFQSEDYAASLPIFDEFLLNSLAIADYYALGLYLFSTMNGEIPTQ